MAEENTTIANITPASFQKYINAITLPEEYKKDDLDTLLVLGPTENWKICQSSNNNFSIVELRPPYVRKVPNETPMIIDWVDSNIKPILIEYQDGSRLEALKLTPNPESMIINSAKKINRYNTMTRWVEEHWGDEIDSINFSGSTYSFNARLNQDNYTGLSSVSRNYSESYKLLKSLVNIYRTNGYLYQEPNGYASSPMPIGSVDEMYDYSVVNRYLLQNPSATGNHPRHGMIRERLYNRISFDYVTLIGYFESFDTTESSSTPFRLIYTSVFKAEKTIWTVGK